MKIDVIKSKISRIFSSRYLSAFLISTGLISHVGTAILRLNSFLPYPKIIDFAAFYVAGFAVLKGVFPYEISPELIETANEQRALLFTPPQIFSPPIWPLLMKPFAYLDYPTAAYIWILLSVALIGLITRYMAELAEINGRWVRFIIFLLILTFGPTFLNLSLGQTGIILVCIVLIVGRGLHNKSLKSYAGIGALSSIAIGSKIFPVTWYAAFVVMRRWRLLIMSFGIIFVLFATAQILLPDRSFNYWFNILPGRVSLATKAPDFDDQSIGAWIYRIGGSNTFNLPGLDSGVTDPISWTLPWSLDSSTQTYLSIAVYIGLFIFIIPIIQNLGIKDHEPGFYLWISCLLIIFPHTARYNHILALPAMGWLWGKEDRFKQIIFLVYFLFGVSRLNHLWARILPGFLVPFVSGSGLLAVLILLLRMRYHLKLAQ